uniref:Uncharacterized protein n=1 Tax=Rhizophagus irregularis (strain DAOM 181602 / DAOM 197198 / MUCL 43194) TaxID=747089 RepID=U9TQB2_RHIID
MNTNLLPCILIDYLDSKLQTYISNSNAENSIQAISIKLSVIINKNEPLIKKPRQARRETKPEEKSLLEPLVTCSEYPNDEQIEQVRELLGNEWDKDRIYQYISRHRQGVFKVSLYFFTSPKCHRSRWG